MIRAEDRVSSVLAQNASLIDVFIGLSPAFERLRSPGMRKVMTKLVTVEQAARIGGVDLERLLARLNEHMDATYRAGEPPGSTAHPNEQQASFGATADCHDEVLHSSGPVKTGKPAALAAIRDDFLVTIDVRAELRAGREPFSMIMAALRERPAEGALCVRATFEPVPLYAVMQRHELVHWTEQFAEDDWIVWFYPETVAAPSVSPTPRGNESTAEVGDDVLVLDVRGLEPPEPMLRTLQALETLPPGATLVQLNERVPKFLLPLLEERGFDYDVREQHEGVVRIFIHHK